MPIDCIELLNSLFSLRVAKMKLQNKVNNVVRSDNFEQSNYTIEASAKAFSIPSIVTGKQTV